MKSKSPRFTEEFGLRMERYLELGLREIGASFMNEKSLKAHYPTLSKVADYLVDHNILIESKAIELHPRSGILRSEEILNSEFERSIVKSYQQLLSTASSIDCNREWLGIVVTYKDLYNGFGKDAWKEFLEAPITKFISQSKISLETLPPENICFLNIEDWDHMIQSIRHGQGTMESIIRKAMDMNASKNPSDKILLFEQALRSHFSKGENNLSYHIQARQLLDKELT